LAGTFVGNGPSVSLGVTEQLLAELPLVEPVEVVVVLVGSTVEDLQALIMGTMAVNPKMPPKPFFKNSVLFIIFFLFNLRMFFAHIGYYVESIIGIA
jgi:hypothetical protein